MYKKIIIYGEWTLRYFISIYIDELELELERVLFWSNYAIILVIKLIRSVIRNEILKTNLSNNIYNNLKWSM